MNAQSLGFSKSDLWNGAKSHVEYFANAFSQTVSIVVSQDTGSDMYERICVLADDYFYMRLDNPPSQQFYSDGDGYWGQHAHIPNQMITYPLFISSFLFW